jgi:hypothetical protein
MSIIAIAGRAGSGKDTVGKIIQCLYYLHKKNINELTVLDLLNDKNLDLNLTGWQVKKFADKLKDIVCILIGCTREQLEDQDFKNSELGEEWDIPLDNSFTDIPGYEGLYQINKLGYIKSLYRVTSLNKVIEESIKSYHVGTNGYFNVTLNKNGAKKTHSVHQLMAITYLNHIPNGYKSVINHIDNNKLNNRIDNIEIVSSRYNTQYSKSTKGVYERNGKFEIYLRIDGVKTYLGSFDDKEKALEIRNKKLKEIDNFIPIRYKPKQWTPRLLLQHLGTNIGRDIIHPNIWVNSLMSEYKPTNLDENGLITAVNDYGIKVSVKPNPILFPEELIYPSWCITDMRFPNEYDAVKSRGGITIRVVREFYEFSNNDHEWGDKECRQGKLLKVNADYFSKEESNKVWRDFLKENDHQSEIALDDHQFDYEIINDAGIPELIEKVKQILITEKII